MYVLRDFITGFEERYASSKFLCVPIKGSPLNLSNIRDTLFGQKKHRL